MPNSPIPAAGEAMPKTKPTDQAVAQAMRDLENDVRELMLMSDIMVNTWDDLGPPAGFDDNSVTYRITKHEQEVFDFLINDVAARANQLKKRFSAAYYGEVLK
jgi:hypothetical protein